jgi:two-component system, NtrC family, response regulator AtoC
MVGAKILIIDDDLQLRKLLRDRLLAHNYQIVEAENGQLGLNTVSKEDPDLILLDLQMPVMDGIEVLAKLQQQTSNAPVIVMTAFGTINKAVEAMKLGAYDFLPKPCKPEHILLVVKKALDQIYLRDENKHLKEQIKSRYYMLIGENGDMRKVVDVAQIAAKSDSTILIEGESGTGKQLMAHHIFAHSPRFNKPFIQVNCTTLSEQLIESDLFGHERGAFTGAIKFKKGRFELADGGTIFLDEIGDLSLSLQAKLLHVLEYGEFQRVGGVETIKVNVRIIAATNRDLRAEIEKQNYRQDLFFRINVVNLKLPSLRSRKEDIQSFSEFFLQKHNRAMGKNLKGFSPDFLDLLLRYNWPGNIRELENVIERAVVLANGPEITTNLLPAFSSTDSLQEAEFGPSLEKAINDFKKSFISKTLKGAENNQTKAAKVLNIQRTYLNKLIKDLKI